MKEYKVVVLGSGGVGKSAITLRYVQGLFVARYNPTIEDFYRHHTKLDDEEVVVEILDTAGTEQYSSLHQLYIDHGQAFVLVYAIDNAASFGDLEPLLRQIGDVKQSKNYPVIIAGNKSDLEANRDISKAEVAATLRDRWNKVVHMETSAKRNHNVSELFRRVLRLIQEFQSTRSREAYKKRRQKQRRCILL